MTFLELEHDHGSFKILKNSESKHSSLSESQNMSQYAQKKKKPKTQEQRLWASYFNTHIKKTKKYDRKLDEIGQNLEGDQITKGSPI